MQGFLGTYLSRCEIARRCAMPPTSLQTTAKRSYRHTSYNGTIIQFPVSHAVKEQDQIYLLLQSHDCVHSEVSTLTGVSDAHRAR